MKTIKKLKKSEIEEYYSRLANPQDYGIDFVPFDLQMKAFEKLMAWQGITPPKTDVEDDKPKKFIIEIKTSE